MFQSRSSEIYGNWRVLNDQGVLMFRTSTDRVDWYLERSLAKKVDENTIQLLFKPNGPGHAGDLFYLAERENKCVVCGTLEELTRHHVVPYSYRRHMPDEYKDHNHHDIVPLCIPCHLDYNVFERQFMNVVAQRRGLGHYAQVVPQPIVLKRKARSAANTLLKHSNEIPEPRRKEMEDLIILYLGRAPTTDDLNNLVRMRIPYVPGRNIYQEVVASLDKDDYQAFAEAWRQFFVDKMKPLHMPTDWDVKRPFGRNSRSQV